MALPIAAQPQRSPAVVEEVAKDPRRHALTKLDALFVIPGVSFDRHLGGLVRRIDDLDGDGIDDLALLRDDVGWARRVDAVSSADGETLRTLWRSAKSGDVALDVGGDVDGDGIPDLLVRRSGEAPSDAFLELVSGRTGAALRRHDIAWSGVARFIEDCGRDGRTDYVVVTEGVVAAFSGVSGAVLWRASPPARRTGSNRPLAPAPQRDPERCSIVGDLDGDAFHDVVVSASGVVRVLSGATGAEVQELDDQVVMFGRPERAAWTSAGDVDGDGVEDLIVDDDSPGHGVESSGVRIVSGRSFETLFVLKYPDGFSEYATAQAVGDIDGDGFDDVALGDANFNLGELGTNSKENIERESRTLQTTSLRHALAMDTCAWMSGGWESGCAVVFSGRTGSAILGVWGLPYSRDGMGLQVAGLPDVTGDGLPDVLVADREQAYAFAGATQSRTDTPPAEPLPPRTAAFRGRILLPGGLPAAGAEIKVVEWIEESESRSAGRRSTGWTDEQGRFDLEVEGSGPRSAEVLAHAAGFAPRAWRFDPLLPIRYDLGDRSLERGATVRVSIRRPDGTPAGTGWTVYATLVGPAPSIGRYADFDPELGACELTDVPAGRVKIRACSKATGCLDPIFLEAEEGETHACVLTTTR